MLLQTFFTADSFIKCCGYEVFTDLSPVIMVICFEVQCNHNNERERCCFHRFPKDMKMAHDGWTVAMNRYCLYSNSNVQFQYKYSAGPFQGIMLKGWWFKMGAVLHLSPDSVTDGTPHHLRPQIQKCICFPSSL